MSKPFSAAGYGGRKFAQAIRHSVEQAASYTPMQGSTAGLRIHA
jgi:hypothetical protein